jgi:hypothetical protein
VRWLSKLFEFIRKVGLFSLRVVVDSIRPPFELGQISRQFAEILSRLSRLFFSLKGCPEGIFLFFRESAASS